MRLSVLAVAIALLTGNAGARADAQATARRPTSIDPQDLALALQNLANDRNVQLIYRSDLVADRRTHGVSGLLTLEEALTQLLSDSGLVHRYLDDGAITIVRRE